MVSSCSWVVCPGVSRKVLLPLRKCVFFPATRPHALYAHRLAVTGTARADQVREYFESKYGPVKEVVSLCGLSTHSVLCNAGRHQVLIPFSNMLHCPFLHNGLYMVEAQ